LGVEPWLVLEAEACVPKSIEDSWCSTLGIALESGQWWLGIELLIGSVSPLGMAFDRMHT